jgi:membrane protein
VIHAASRWLITLVVLLLTGPAWAATTVTAMIFKLLPDVTIAWRNVWLGAAVTALLFTAGKSLIGLYLGRSAVASAYGAAGSLVVILIWIYYSAQILFFGAEFTKVYTRGRASPGGGRGNGRADDRLCPHQPRHGSFRAPAPDRVAREAHAQGKSAGK